VSREKGFVITQVHGQLLSVTGLRVMPNLPEHSLFSRLDLENDECSGRVPINLVVKS
jgi:hypothetical protein